jgi:chemotaxis protein MotB
VAESRGKKRNHHEEEHEEHVNHEAWVIPYADMLTLLMALFLVMWAVGNTDEGKLRLAAESFRKELGGHSAFDIGVGTGGSGPLTYGGVSILDGAGPAPVAGAETDSPTGSTTLPESSRIPPDNVVIIPLPDIENDDGDDAVDLPDDLAEPVPTIEGVPGDPLDEVERVVRRRASGTGFGDSITLRREDRGLVVTIVTDRVLFDAGQADVQQAGTEILDVVAEALLDVPNLVVIEGHSDKRPISTSRFRDNWDLSAIRATSVLRYFVDEWDFPPERLNATGWGDTRPIADGDDAASLARNRRVEIVVLENI